MAPVFKLTAVGVGPGDPELITLKGVRTIQAADLICVPGKEEMQAEESPILRAAERLIDTDWQKVLNLSLPITLQTPKPRTSWRKAAQQILRQFQNLAKAQPRRKEIQGVYLLFEDPLLYGSFVYVWRELLERQPDMKIEIVPGITTFAAAAALAQIPLSTQADQVIILFADQAINSGQLAHHLSSFETVILLHAGPVLPEILTVLKDMGLSNSAYFIERVGLPHELVFYDMRNLEGQRRSPFSVLIVQITS